MNKDPKKFNGQVPLNNTYSNERDGSKVAPLAIDLLPAVFKTDINKKILSAVVEDMFQPSAIENINYVVGRPKGNNKIKQEQLPRPNARRQLESGLLVDDSTGTRLLTADDIALAQGHADLHMLEPAQSISVLDLPINPDKFVNWSNYYWLEEGMPTLYIVGSELNSGIEIDVERDIIGQQFYTLPAQSNGKTLELKNGMRVVFQKAYPNRNSINGDTVETHTADGSNQIDFFHEMTQQYDKLLIEVRVNGVLKRRLGTGADPDYTFTYGSLLWLADKQPGAGATVEITLPDYWVSFDSTEPTTTPRVDRRWQVEGVGTAAGIRLLPRSMQTTSTVYSSTIQSLWDQTTVPWDRIEWDGDIPGINKKHYVLQSSGASNRSAFSRVNVWVHKDTVQTVCDYLDIKAEELVNDSKSALRPIIEFDHRLEVYTHGTKFRHWVDTVIDRELDITALAAGRTGANKLIGYDVVTMLVYTMFGSIDNTNNGSSKLFDRIISAVNSGNQTALDDIVNGFEDKTLIIETLASILTILRNLRQGKIKNIQRRVLWLVDDENKNKIVTFKTDNNNIVYRIDVESAQNGDATVVQPGGGTLAMMEYYWKNNQALPAQTRLTATQTPLFRIYDRNQVALDQWQTEVGFKPTRLCSSIIEFAEGTTLDTESGYKLTFLPSQFKNLNPSLPAATPVYDVVCKFTLQDDTKYLNADGNERAVPGPFNFRRLQSVITEQEQDLNIGLSFGYRRAWFRLRSWASNTYDLSAYQADEYVDITLDASSWPAYQWNLTFIDGKPVVQHTDNFETSVDNLMVGALGEKLKLNTVAVNQLELLDYSGNTVLTAVPNGQGLLEIDIPNTIETGFYNLRIDSLDIVKLLLITPEIDPRSPQVRVNGLATDYQLIAVKDSDNNVTGMTVRINAVSGIAEIQHQGEFTSDSDHATGLPGIEYNPLQDLNLGNFTPSRLASGMFKCIQSNAVHGSAIWTQGAQLPGLNGSVMADVSSIRSVWLENRTTPSITESLASKAMSSWRWYRKFIALVDKYHTMYDLSVESKKEIVDKLLEELTIGVNYSQADAVSGMAFSTTAMNHRRFVANGIQQQFEINTGEQKFYQGIFGPDHVYVYQNGQLLASDDYYIQDKKVGFLIPLAEGTVLDIYHSGEEFAYSGIPASPAKLGLAGVFKPKLVRETWGGYDRVLIQRHDGSRVMAYQEHWFANADPRDQVILELENRIYNACVNRIGDRNRQRLNRIVSGNLAVSSQRAQAELQWLFSNNIDYRDRSDFEADNPWTWNYDGLSWRGIYSQAFGTLEIHSCPWEALGFDEKPTWWDQHYSWTDPVKRTALENALYGGQISEPGQSETYDLRVRRQHTLGFPVSVTGRLLNPVEWGMPAPSVDQAQQPWDIGSYSPIEDVWLRSPAGVWATVIDQAADLQTANEFVERGINPFVTPNKNNSPAVVGDLTLAPSNFAQVRPTIGIGAVLFETNRELNLLGESPLLEMTLISPTLQFAVGGFTDQTARFRMYHTRYQNGSYVPEEDFALSLNDSVAKSVLRYSAVRLEKDGTGFRVYGYDPEQRYFEVATPIRSGATGGISGSYQRTISAGTNTYIEYVKWNLTPTKIKYGHLLADKQSLFEFFCGLDRYQTSQGLVFDQVNDRGGIDNWQQAGLDAFSWIEENWGSQHFVIVSPAGAATGFKFKHNSGQLDRLDSDLLRRGKIIFASGRLALANDLLITREYEENTDFIQPLNDEQIVFADLKVRNYDHVFYFNSKTRFNDILIDRQTNQRLDYFNMVARRSRGWTGRYQANGLLPVTRGTLPGFDALISDIVESRRPEKSQFDTFIGTLSKSNVVPSKTSVIREIIQDPGVEFQFNQGLQSVSGTNLAFDALLRNSAIDLPGRTQDLSINEQWLFTDGEFGRLGNRRIWEIELRKTDIVNDRQVVRFLEGQQDIDLRSDNIIDIVGTRDLRWVNRDYQNIFFDTIDRSTINRNSAIAQGWLPSAGVANLDLTDVKAKTISNLAVNDVVSGNSEKIQHLLEIRSFSKYQNYKPEDLAWNEGQLYKCVSTIVGGENTAFDATQWINYNSFDPAVALPPSIWVSDYNFQDPLGVNPADKDSVGWNVLQMIGPSYVEEACPNALNAGLNESKVTFGSPHQLKVGDVFLMTGSGDGNYDKFHVVKSRVDDFNVLIEGRSTSGVPVFNLTVFKLASMKFASAAQLQTLTLASGYQNGMLAYIEPDGTAEGEYAVYQLVDGTWTLKDEYSTVGKTMVNTHAIESVSLLDANTEDLLATIEVFDPYKGLTVDEVAQYVAYRNGADPAVYNLDDLGLEDLDANNFWGVQQLGTLWWDTGAVRYVEYEQGSLNYRTSHWGEQFADSRVAVYEWTRSEELPTIDSQPDARLDMSNGVGAIRYCKVEEDDSEILGATKTYYYFWKGNVSTLPVNVTRKYSALDIQTVLENPNVAGVSWFSPVDTNAFIIANIRSYLTARDSVILRIEQKETAEQQHVNGILVSEGFTGDVVPEYLYRRLRSSLTGRDNYRKNYKLKTWEPNTAYEQGDYVINWNYSTQERSDSEYGARDIPIIQILDDGREEVKAVLKPILADTDVNEAKLHRVFYVRAEGYVSSTDFKQDFLDEHIVVSATSALIKDTLESEEYRAVVVARRRVPDPRLHPLRRYGNAYVPVPQTWFKEIREARRNLVRSANAYLLKINAVNKDHWDAHLREYQPLFGPYIKDLEPYWEYADYLAEGYQFGTEQLLVTNPSAVLEYEESTGTEVTLFGVVDSNGVIQKSFAKSGIDTTLVYQRNGTIQFKDAVWDGSLGDAWDMTRWDRYAWDEDNSEVVESILTALREDLFVGNDVGYFNLTFFDMVKESLRQVPNANWVSKTTYIDLNQQSNNDLTLVPLYINRKDYLVKQYVNEVKPYHTKIIDLNQSLTSNESVTVGIEESITLNIDYADYKLADELGNILTDENGKVLVAVDTRSATITLSDGE